MELLECQIESGEVALIDRSIIECGQRFANEVIDFALHIAQFLGRIGIARLRGERQHAISQRNTLCLFVPFQIGAEPGAGRTEARQQQQRAPDVVAVFLEEGPLGAVDIGRSAAMRRQRGILVGIGRGDVGRARQFSFQGSAHREQLPREGPDRSFRELTPRHDQMIDADGFDLVVGPRRRRREGAARDLLRLVKRMLLRNRLGDVDRQESGFATFARRRRDGLGGDLAVQRANRHEGIEASVMRHFAELVDRELHDRDFFRRNARLAQDDAQQRDIGLRGSDHAEAPAGEIGEVLDLGRRDVFRALAGDAGRRPEHHHVLAQDRN